MAEEIVFGTITTGAESDIQQLTQIARGMVGRWGMSRAIGPIAVLPQDQNGPLLPGSAAASETTQRLVDDEVRRIVEEAHAEVLRLLTEHRDQLDSLTDALLREETLDEDAAYAAAQVARETADTGGEPTLAALDGAPPPAEVRAQLPRLCAVEARRIPLNRPGPVPGRPGDPGSWGESPAFSRHGVAQVFQREPVSSPRKRTGKRSWSP